MRLSDKGCLEIAEHEGIVPAPYYDSVGVLTFGIGHTAAAGRPDPADMPKGVPADLEAAIDRAVDLFAEDVGKYERRVADAIKVPLKQHEFDALVSFDFNTGGIYRAILTQRVNAGDPNAYESFMGWLKPPEIRNRRTAEMRLFQTGDYDANGTAIPVWGVDTTGKLRGIAKQIDGKDVLRRMKRPASLASPSNPPEAGSGEQPASPAGPHEEVPPQDGLMVLLARIWAFLTGGKA